MPSGTKVFVEVLPKCDLCGATAAYDAVTVMGPWANLCKADFKKVGVGLGLGRGQMLVLRAAPGKVV
jgi:hypothetical protein